ncbi:hypothetical protein [Streptomyces coffeae]|uniref:Uncharacterized protein n=1 Tax=Streptomyces coffeae TaxID=621382 RepID=A0ABS1NRM5_9ACTN|nr:hypothetical protein [Streptomyces coffeae]MBL1102673.1 hypothetical protein [Streptomyces coffeae]
MLVSSTVPIGSPIGTGSPTGTPAMLRLPKISSALVGSGAHSGGAPEVDRRSRPYARSREARPHRGWLTTAPSTIPTRAMSVPVSPHHAARGAVQKIITNLEKGDASLRVPINHPRRSGACSRIFGSP